MQPLLRRQKRAFFLSSPWVLVNDVVASPYMEYALMSPDTQHRGFHQLILKVAPNAFARQALVSSVQVPFLLLNRVAAALSGW